MITRIFRKKKMLIAQEKKIAMKKRNRRRKENREFDSGCRILIREAVKRSRIGQGCAKCLPTSPEKKQCFDKAALEFF